jgi:hypothetical protein
MRKPTETSYTVSIAYRPGDGFYVTTVVAGNRYETPDAFGTLEGAAQFAARYLVRAGYCADVGAE